MIKTTPLVFQGLRILLADDAQDNRYLLRRMLELNGAMVETACDGKEAMDKTSEQEFDIVLMDIEMPVTDGYEATRTLRDNGFKKPIIALTGHSRPADKAMTEAAGCSGHLTKPLKKEELFETIKLHTALKH